MVFLIMGSVLPGYMFRYQYCLVGGLEAIVFGSIRWCVWSFRPSSPLRLPHLKCLLLLLLMLLLLPAPFYFCQVSCHCGQQLLTPALSGRSVAAAAAAGISVVFVAAAASSAANSAAAPSPVLLLLPYCSSTAIPAQSTSYLVLHCIHISLHFICSIYKHAHS